MEQPVTQACSLLQTIPATDDAMESSTKSANGVLLAIGPLDRLMPSSPSAIELLDRHVPLSPSALGTLDGQITSSSYGKFLFEQRTRVQKTRMIRQRLEQLHQEASDSVLHESLRQHGLRPPERTPTSVMNNSRVKYLLDRHKQSVFSEFIRRTRIQLPEFVRLLRGESAKDSRPNKALEEPRSSATWNTYRYRSRWQHIVLHGVVPSWKSSFKPQPVAPPNHGSAKRALNVIIKHLRKGQDSNRYLILDIDLLPLLQDVTCSPFGAVQKGDVDLSVDARIIHDLSFPPGESVNDNTEPDREVEVAYDGPEALGNRIMDVAGAFPTLQRMMTGDVNGAFRNIPMSADHVGRFAGTIPELGILIVDLCCPFGWKNSPSSYWIAGAAIGHLYASSGPVWPLQPLAAKVKFDAKTWCDDHVAIEPDIGSRLAEAELALRSAMVTILGPDACNEKKFTSWFQTGRALGLDWDMPAQTVSMPLAKVEKALLRLHTMVGRTKTTRTDLQKLLGSLRHVVTCIRAAAPFFQRVAALARSAPRFGYVTVSDEAKDDLRWFKVIIGIGRLNAIPLARFVCRHEPHYQIQMDASDQGLCALFPARREFLQVKFTPEEQELIHHCNETGDSTFCINVRELLSAVFASLVWGPSWKSSNEESDTHVRFFIDNTSAVAWNNRKSSRNTFAQLLLRIMALCEVQHGFYSTASHVAGVDNIMADAGSRVWLSPSLAITFSNLSSGWSQVQVPDDSRDLSNLWERYCERGL